MCISFGDLFNFLTAFGTLAAVVVAVYISLRQHKKYVQKEELNNLSDDYFAAVTAERVCNMITDFLFKSIEAIEKDDSEKWKIFSVLDRAYEMTQDARKRVHNDEIAWQLQKIYASIFDARFYINFSKNNIDYYKLKNILNSYNIKLIQDEMNQKKNYILNNKIQMENNVKEFCK